MRPGHHPLERLTGCPSAGANLKTFALEVYDVAEPGRDRQWRKASAARAAPAAPSARGSSATENQAGPENPAYPYHLPR